MHTLDTVPLEINLLDKNIFKPSSLTLLSVTAESESQEYLAHRLKLGQQEVAFRRAKITPTKTGQFVTLWKRDAGGITCPFDATDGIDYAIILTQTALFRGVFIFPKAVLVTQGIFSQETKAGKRGFRVYPSWDTVDSKQAQKTQSWQLDYFVNLSLQEPDLQKIKQLFRKIL